MVAHKSELDAILRQVESWPTQERLMLARRVLESLERLPSGSSPVADDRSLAELLRDLKSQGLTVSDDEFQSAVNEFVSKHSLRPPESGPRGRSSAEIVEAFRSGGVPPTDEECKEILVEALMRKHLKRS